MASQPTTEATSDEEIHQSAVDNAALNIEKEQHQAGGVLDAVKALFLWVESPEERISSDQAQSPRAQS